MLAKLQARTLIVSHALSAWAKDEEFAVDFTRDKS